MYKKTHHYIDIRTPYPNGKIAIYLSLPGLRWVPPRNPRGLHTYQFTYPSNVTFINRCFTMISCNVKLLCLVLKSYTSLTWLFQLAFVLSKISFSSECSAYIFNVFNQSLSFRQNLNIQVFCSSQLGVFSESVYPGNGTSFTYVYKSSLFMTRLLTMYAYPTPGIWYYLLQWQKSPCVNPLDMTWL